MNATTLLAATRLCAALLVIARGVYAADDPVAESPPQSSVPSADPAAHLAAPPRSIEEIVVTAEKKEQNIQEVPISITAVGGDFIREAGLDDVHQLTAYTPNVKFTTNPGTPTVFIRGFGTPFGGTALEPSVGLALDELSIPKEIYMSDPMYDLERFEVLRGPQGTLFGKNTPAGLFNLTTSRPTHEFTATLLGRVGSLGVHRVEGAISGPIPGLREVAQFRLAGVDLRQAGDVHNTKLDIGEPGAKQHAGRAELALQPLADTDILLSGSLASTNSRIFHNQLSMLRPADLEFIRQFDPRAEDDPFNHQNSVNLRHNLDRDTYLLQTNVTQRLPWLQAVKDAQLVGVFGHTGFDQSQPVDVDWSPADILNSFPADLNYAQSSAELRFLGAVPAPLGFGSIELQVGGLYFVSHLFSNQQILAGEDFDEYLLSAPGFELITGMQPPGGIGFEDVNKALGALGLDPLGNVGLLQGDGVVFFLRQRVQSKALFGNASWHITDRWTLSFGGRLTFEDKDAHARNTCPGRVVCAAIGAEEFDARLSRHETDFSPKATLQYSPFDALTLFATRGQGFKSGGFNNFAFTRDAVEVDTETAVSYEVGAKGRLLSETLAYGATLFRMEVDGLQLQTVNQGVVQTRNAASARSQGLELDLRYLTPWEPLSVQGAAAFTDARFIDFPNAPAPVSSGMDSQDLSGKRMPFVSKAEFNVTPELHFPLRSAFVRSHLSRDLALTTALDIGYKSNLYLDNDLDLNTLQHSYTVANARARLSTDDDKLSLGFAIDNISNTDALEFKNDSVTFPHAYASFQEFQRRYWFDVRLLW